MKPGFFNHQPGDDPADSLEALQAEIYHEARTRRGPMPLLMNSLLDRRNLEAAWQRTRSADGADSPGPDGVICSALRDQVGPWLGGLADDLFHGRYCPSPPRIIEVPKPDKPGKMRRIGILNIRDRVVQSALKQVLEPVLEPAFLQTSFGFCPGRSVPAALATAVGLMTPQEGQPAPFACATHLDVANCFEKINQPKLLDKIDTFKLLRRVIKGGLKAGIMDGGELFPSEEGTPQGGVISPLLANIALHGLEEEVATAFPKSKKLDGRIESWTPKLIRYANDLLWIHQDLEVVNKCKEIVTEKLKDMGLELKTSKTFVSHTLDQHVGRVGFDFLGFNVRQYRVGKHHSGKTGRGRPLGFKTIIKPSKTKVKVHHEEMRGILRRLQGAHELNVITWLTPKILGWTNYYRTVVSKATFSNLDERMYSALRSWTRRKHPDKSAYCITKRYWRIPGWHFGTKDVTLPKHAQTKIKRHVKVPGKKSPFDGDWRYWASRWGYYPNVCPVKARMLKTQKGRCAHCNGLFQREDDLIERHHKDGNRANNHRSNFELLHRHCHDEVHRQPKARDSP